MMARSSSSPPSWRRNLVSALVAGVLIVAFLAWRRDGRSGGQVYVHVEALDDGSVVVAKHDFDHDELELRLVRGASTLWTRTMPLADQSSVTTGAVSTSEEIAVPFNVGLDTEYHVLRRSDGAPTGTFRVAPGSATRAVYGRRLVSLQAYGAGLDYEIHDLASPEAAGITRTVDCMGASEPFATSSRLLIYSGARNVECAGLVLGEDGESTDTDFGPWNHTESPWPVAIEPGGDRLLVRTEDALEAWDLAGAAEPDRLAAVPEGIRALRLLGAHARRLVLVGYDGNPTWVDGTGHPPNVALYVVDPATRSIALQTSLAPFAIDETDPPGAPGELPRFALVRARPLINDETEQRALFVMIDVTTGEESWRTDEMLLPGGGLTGLVRSANGSVLMLPRESSVVIARFAGATGWVDRVVEVSGASLLGRTSWNDEVVALSIMGDRPGWMLLSTETLDVVATSFDDAERDRHLADGSASLVSLVPLPPPALSRSALLDHSARHADAR